MENAIVSYTKNVSVWKLIFGLCVVFSGLTLIFYGGILFGAMFTVIGINLCVADGSELDLNNKTFRIVKSFFGIKIGVWKPIPKFEYVSVFKTKETQQVNIITASTRFTGEVILLNVFYETNKHFTFYKTTDKEDAFRVAHRLKDILEIDILDATEREKKWL